MQKELAELKERCARLESALENVLNNNYNNNKTSKRTPLATPPSHLHPSLWYENHQRQRVDKEKGDASSFSPKMKTMISRSAFNRPRS